MQELKYKDAELADGLQKIANKQDALLIGFIAPDTLVRKSPVTYDYATITVQDLYNLEEKIEEIKKRLSLPKKLHLIIQTPGGSLNASAKIAKYLQKCFKEIEAYVPYEAASGGTILCLAAKKIIMNTTSNLTPIDPQMKYKDRWVSATSYKQSVEDFEKEYANKKPDEIPSPFQQMATQFDPVIMKEFDKTAWDTMDLAWELLTYSQKPRTPLKKVDLFRTIIALGKTNYPHSHIIDVNEAEKIGLNISKDSNKLELLKIYKKWVSCRLKEEETIHVIDVFCPKKKDEKPKTKKRTKK